MTWNPDDPFPPSAALGETDGGARNLPAFLVTLVEPGDTLVVGASEVALAAAAAGHRVTVLDWGARRLTRLAEAASERGLEISVACREPEKELALPARAWSGVICVDVLERVRDDALLLGRLHRLLEPGGRLVARVRACPWVREEAGRVPGKPRRYDPEELRRALEEASFRVLRLRHWNLVGVPAAILWDRLLRRPHRDSGGMPASERPRRWWESVLDGWYGTVERRVGFPAGVSLVAVATPHLERARVRRPEFDRGLAGRAGREAYEPMATAR